MAQTSLSNPEPPPATTNFLRRLFGGRGGASSAPPPTDQPPYAAESANGPVSEKPNLIRRVSRKVIPGIPRAQTFRRQLSEKRTNLSPVQPTPAERRAVSVDRRVVLSRSTSNTDTHSFPRASAPELLGTEAPSQPSYVPSLPASPVEEHEYANLDRPVNDDSGVDLQADSNPYGDCDSVSDARSITSAQIHEELEKKWILNLSMHFRDKSKREKFFVTYREQPTLWRRVTISLDYRGAPENSLEADLLRTKFQRDKSAKIYEAIRESLVDIQFYNTVTNLKLQTTDGRLHVHVVEDVNEIIEYPSVRQVKHLGCRRVRERDIDFDSHMSGFVYKVAVNGQVLIKKEIPGPDTIEEFLYEINALNSLRFSKNVIGFYGLVVDDQDEYVKGLLIDFADQGALIDVIFDHRQEAEMANAGAAFPWSTRVKWARQVVQGLADIHESGFVQGDFTLSNIVINDQGDAKIIDMNRRGCPVGWEPPEATPQLGMVLWALAVEDDEPEVQRRPLVLGDDVMVPEWYRQMVEICLSENPRLRLQASSLLSLFPPEYEGESTGQSPPSASEKHAYLDPYAEMAGYQGNGDPRIRTVSPSNRWPYGNIPQVYDPGYLGYEAPFAYPTRGRSPPSPLPSNSGYWDARSPYGGRPWSRSGNMASYSDAGDTDEDQQQDRSKSITPTKTTEPTDSAEKVGDAGASSSGGGQGVAAEQIPGPAVVGDTAEGEGALNSTRPDVQAHDGPSEADPARHVFTDVATVSLEDETGLPPSVEGSHGQEALQAGGEGGAHGVGSDSGGDLLNKDVCIPAEAGDTEPIVQAGSENMNGNLATTMDKPGEVLEPVEQAEPSSAALEPVEAEGGISGDPAPTASEVVELVGEIWGGEKGGGEKKNDKNVDGAGQGSPLSDETPRPRSPSKGTTSSDAEELTDDLAGVGGAYDEGKTDLAGFSATLENELDLLGSTPGNDSTQLTTGTTDSTGK